MHLRLPDFRVATSCKTVNYGLQSVIRKLQPAFIIAVFGLMFSGCVSTTDYDAMKADINQLKKDGSDLNNELASAKKLLSGAAKEESFIAIRESQLSMYSQISEISKELQVLKGRFEENKFSADKALRDAFIEKELLRSQINSIELRIKEINEKIGRGIEAKASQPEQKTATETADTETAEQKIIENEDPKKAYEAAYDLLKNKKYKPARDSLIAFLKKFPKDNLAGNAQFWLGETYYAEKDFEGAILAYEICIKNYPKNDKTPAALLKQGLAFIEIGDKKTAKVIFEKLTEKHPASKEAEAAKKELAALAIKTPSKPQKTHKKK